MSLEHALLVSLCEQPAAGLELTRRFDRSIGFFWTATHQQIYRVLGRMEHDGWVRSSTVAQSGRPAKKVYETTDLGREVLADWIGTPTGLEPLRSEVAVKIRGASYADRDLLRKELAELVALHRQRLATYEVLRDRDYPDPPGPGALADADLDRYHVLRGGVLAEQTAITWLTDYLEAVS